MKAKQHYIQYIVQLAADLNGHSKIYKHLWRAIKRGGNSIICVPCFHGPVHLKLRLLGRYMEQGVVLHQRFNSSSSQIHFFYDDISEQLYLIRRPPSNRETFTVAICFKRDKYKKMCLGGCVFLYIYICK